VQDRIGSGFLRSTPRVGFQVLRQLFGVTSCKRVNGSDLVEMEWNGNEESKQSIMNSPNHVHTYSVPIVIKDEISIMATAAGVTRNSSHSQQARL